MNKTLLQTITTVAFFVSLLTQTFAQTITIDGKKGGKLFDGIGAVSGGGATSVLLKDYPEPQRSQILDLLFKPQFGASMSALYVEVPGDGNSTQGSELSHMHSRNDLNYSRGYEWWIINEAKKRNNAITLDGCAWGAPGWVGNNNFASQDMADYYVKWIQGLKSVYGWNMDAIGYRNEKGVDENWIKTFKKTLISNGLNKIKIHAFDNWNKQKWDWIKDMKTDPELKNAVDIVSNHTIDENPAPDSIKQLLTDLGKPLWNSEEHVYKKGFDCEISLVNVFNRNYINSGVTKIMSWYLVTSFYPAESFYDVTAINASSPWSGNYTVNPALWAYAHYGQFVKLGWKYLDGACGNLSQKGTYVTLTSGKDYSTIIETKGAATEQMLTLNITGGLSAGKVTVWKSDSLAQFIKQADISPVNGAYTIKLAPNAIYTVSTTTGQQKGTISTIPAAKGFPFPYYETFDHYSDAKSWGYLPHYTADIDGGFELVNSPDGKGKSLRQVISEKAISWAPEWMPYTIIGDTSWRDYEVSANISLDNGGWAGVMGRISNTGSGYGCNPKGYYMRLYTDGKCELYSSNQKKNGDPGILLASGKVPATQNGKWYNVKLQFSGTKITGFVDDKQVLTVTNTTYKAGLAGLVTGGDSQVRNTALFDDLLINTVNGEKPKPTLFVQDAHPIYRASK